MSEKNSTNTPWTKQSDEAQKLHTHTTDAGSFGHLQANVLPHPLYIGVNESAASVPPYIPGRFQTPSVHLAPLTTNALSTAPNILPPNTAATGFFTPSFTSTTTSVLTPNPFALQINSNVAPSPFTAEQYHHLNHQQLDLSKIKLSPSTSVHTVPKFQQMELSPNDSGGTLGAIPESVLSTFSASVSSHANSVFMQRRSSGIDMKGIDKEKLNSIQQTIELSVSIQTKEQIKQILEKVSFFKPVEKLLLYMRLPGELPESDPLRQSQNPLGTRSEISHTINWVRTHLEHDPQVSIPKQDVYNDYIAFCERENIKPLSTADFGKVMKQVFPGIRPRRLGTRGNSRYCYAAMRKTTKLPAPELPSITDNVCTNSDGDDTSADAEHYKIIIGWAEKILNTKVASAKDLANHIRALQTFGSVQSAENASTNVVSKKLVANETKERQYNTDMGPLKKRRKKKCKNICNEEALANPELSPTLESASKNLANLKKAASTTLRESTFDEQDMKPSNTISVKQEIMDSPNSSNSVQTMRDNFIQQNLQQQLMPINLAADSRTILVKTQPVDEEFISVGAVKNLTPKFVEAAQAALAQFSETPPNERSGALPTANIKEENTDDYFLTNVFCKKVLKAQQIKGFWNNSMVTSQVNATPVITTTAATPPPVATLPLSATNAAISAGNVIENSATRNYLMGPPAQIAANASTSPLNTIDNNNGPKVASRNMLLLKAKRQLQTQGAVAADSTAELNVKDGGDLPEDLGLPRERVISICNMDKHELDDYFLPEEENSEEPESELLQYFQPGDAEEKVRSLDAAQKTRIATAKQTSKTKIAEEEEEAQIKEKRARKCSDALVKNEHKNALFANNITSTTIGSDAYTNCGDNTLLKTTNAPLSIATTPAVGSASASLAQIYEKHQKLQQKNNFVLDANSDRSKLSMCLDSGDNLSRKLQTSSVRKNCIFLPISPNINTKNDTINTNAASRSLFASPDAAKIRSKAAFNKQQSLDLESSDPMIGANRRRRNYAGVITITTSASAPPSPSVLQQRNQFMYSNSNKTNNWPYELNEHGNFNDITTNSSLVGEPSNSLDLDFFEETPLSSSTRPQNMYAYDNSADCSQLGFPMLEAQRSQSVPLSQLQRVYSPPSVMHNNNNFAADYVACDATLEKANKTDFLDDVIKLENTEKDQTTSLEEAGVLASDSTALLDEMDVSDLLSSPDFVERFTNTTTTCSSQYSSSGYNSTSANTTFGNINGTSSSVSRSVPSTPLPHNPKSFNDFHFYEKRHKLGDATHFSPTANWSSSLFRSSFNAKYSSCNTARSAFDISKSMPTTPITNPSFRYSPLDMPETHDFLINGSTVDSLDSSFDLAARNSKTSLTNTDIGINMGVDVASNSYHADAGVFSGNISVGETFNSRASDNDSMMMSSDLLSSL